MIQKNIPEVTPELVFNLIKDYQSRSEWLAYLQNYYKSHHKILSDRDRSANSKEDNRLVANYPGYIVDVNTGYFMGKPVAYSAAVDKTSPGFFNKIATAISPKSNENFLHELIGINDYNNEQDKNIINAKTSAIKGTTYELVYIDEQSNVRFSPIDPVTSFMVYSTKVEPEPVLFVCYWTIKEGEKYKLHALAYDKNYKYEYSGASASGGMLSGKFTEDRRDGHPFGMVPAVEYPNNDERQGDFEKVITLIDAYDKAMSDTSNDLEYFADAYLKIINMSGTNDEDIQKMRESRIVLVDADGDADWMVKQTTDAGPENHKNRLKQDIFTFVMTPDMADENFGGNVTGIGMQYRLWALEQSIAQKERKFKRGLQRRIELIANYMKAHNKKYDWRSIEIMFTRNVPPVLGELVDAVTKLRGFISDVTLMGWLPQVDDPAEERERVDQQREGTIDLSQYMTEDDEEAEV